MLETLTTTPSMLETLTTTRDVIKALGGPTAVGRLTGRKVQAVSNWGASRNFPANTYLTITEALREAGKEAPSWLWGMEAVPQDGAE